MSSSALDSQGMTIAVSPTDSPEAYTTIPEVTEINGPDGSAAFIDTTDLSSTAKSRRPGLQDNGNITLSLMYVPANTVHAALRTYYAANTLVYFRITFTDSPATTWTFAGYVGSLQVTNTLDEVTRATVTISVDGAITEA